ncbi:MAG: hypothetical protein ABSH51_32010, partial [Solirubrobacteraceae bacterium]
MHTVGRIVQRVADEQLDEDRLTGLFAISIDGPLVRHPCGRRAHRHVSDHADEVDGTIAFACRCLDAPAIASATFQLPAIRPRSRHRGLAAGAVEPFLRTQGIDPAHLLARPAPGEAGARTRAVNAG